MRAYGVSALQRVAWVGPKLEGISGGVTLLIGLGTVLGLAFAPVACPEIDGPCFGLLGPSPSQWLDVPAIVLTWLPLVCITDVGLGAVLNARGRPHRMQAFRWLSVLALAASTFGMLVVSSFGPLMVPAFLLAYWTAAVSEVRFWQGRGTASLGGVDVAALASLAALALLIFTLAGLSFTI